MVNGFFVEVKMLDITCEKLSSRIAPFRLAHRLVKLGPKTICKWTHSFQQKCNTEQIDLPAISFQGTS